jgi:putative transposase
MALPQSAVSELLDPLCTGEGVDPIRESVRMMMQELIEADAAEKIGAAPYEWTQSRTTDRNGTPPRLLVSPTRRRRVADCEAGREIVFRTILEPWRRSTKRCMWW